MTKVLANIDLLAYQQEMKETLRRVIQNNLIGGIRRVHEGAMPPYNIVITLYDYEGRGDDFIGVIAIHEFDIQAMHITIWDEAENLIESGELEPFPNDPDLWFYLPEVEVPAGTSVIVEVTAVDCMGGVGRQWEGKTLGEEEF